MHYKVNIFYMQLSKIKPNKICNEDKICRQIRINAARALSIMRAEQISHWYFTEYCTNLHLNAAAIYLFILFIYFNFT